MNESISICEDPFKQKRNYLVRIEADVQREWENQKIYEVDAPSDEREKFFATIPYPYMNGLLHIGHAFSISKADFMIRFQRMLGKTVLFPFGLHCTGMPIVASADKLRRELNGEEIEVFSEDEEDEPLQKSYRSQKSKAVSKGQGMKQSDILRSMEVDEETIPRFVDPTEWISYFPREAIIDLKLLGVAVDWRRTFITTELNPYYDSFVQWQFRKLQAGGHIEFGKRYTIYSTHVEQPCLDHDRAKGEGVIPQEYVLIKLKIMIELKELETRDVFLVAATLRPETMYGQTNCWILPSAHYVCLEGKNNEVYICSKRSAINMAYQNLSPEWGKPNILRKITGKELIGIPLSAPLTNKLIYVLPLMTINMKKGTGIVTSVPSDSPDDYRALMDLFEESDTYKKWLLEPIEIINVPGLGHLSAKTVCIKMNITNQFDKEKLLIAKKQVYLLGNRDGIMLVGKYTGMNVAIAKPLIKEMLITSGDALRYFEPEKQVISRHGDRCIVALTDQWFIDYGQEAWKAKVRKLLEKLETYNHLTKKGLAITTDWLHEWPCSRTFGLGSRIPWDDKWLIDSLSDSTIYMAYYTVSHLLQGDIRGSKPGLIGLEPQQITEAVWDYVFLGADVPSGIPEESIIAMRREFEFWYPMDLRTSGRDLIQNHLTFTLFNHTAIFREKHWPQGIRTNGFVLLDMKKMSKQTGNFITLRQAIKEYGTDAVRFALAEAGDSGDSSDAGDDANFSQKIADDAIIRLYEQIKWAVLMYNRDDLRTGDFNVYDKIVVNSISESLSNAKVCFERMLFREALQQGFYKLQNARDLYRINVNGNDNMHQDVVRQFIEIQTLTMVPITPHWSEYIWQNVMGRRGSASHDRRYLLKYLQTDFTDLKISVTAQLWPHEIQIDPSVILMQIYMENVIKVFWQAHRKFLFPGHRIKRLKSDIRGCQVYVSHVYSEWQKGVLEILQTMYDPETNDYSEKRNIAQRMHEKGLGSDMKMRIAFAIEMMKIGQITRGETLTNAVPFDEKEVLHDMIGRLQISLDCSNISIDSKEGDALHPEVKFFGE